MKCSLTCWIGLLALCVLTVGMVSGEETEKVQGKIIGVGTCKTCHKSAKSGNQFGIWEANAHAKAFATLASEASLAIAKEKGIEDPQKAPECLSCHTTQGFLGEKVALDEKGKYTPEEGVSCEACHGAGSEYKSMKVMKDQEAAVAAGLVIPTEKTCLGCHNENSPTYKEFKFEERLAQIAHPVPKAEE